MFKNNLDLQYYCPRCRNNKIIEFDDSIHCSICKSDFYKAFFGVIDDRNMLSLQELGGIADTLDEEEKKKLGDNIDETIQKERRVK